MFERLRTLYRTGRIDEAGLITAIARGWITQADADMILGEPE